MLVYPFDPQCRLDSNWIPKETLPAFPSSATRTLVPSHAPFFIKDCKVFKGSKELKEGEDFHFSIEHKVASHATAYPVYGGITIIKDELIPPFTIQYHPQGGTFEATTTQIKSYLDKKPNVWDSSWEALIASTYYPPVKVLYDKEAFVSETEVIAAIKQLEDAIGAKDEKEDISYGLFKVRIDNMRLQLEQLKTDEHLSAKGNPHKAKHFHAGALAKDGIAANSHKIDGLTKQAFIDKLLSLFPPLSSQLENGFQQNTDMSVGERLVIDGGVMVFGDSSVLEMDEEQLTQTSDNAVKIIADREAKRPGATVSINAGGNTLTVISTGNTVDSKKFKINEVEVVTEDSLKAYASEAVLGGSAGLVVAESPTVSMIGSGKMDSPLEAIVSIPVSNASIGGTIKVVNEGSNGYPCPGYLNNNFYIFHKAGNQYIGLRNGADDLESDVFITNVTIEPFKISPTAERFRPRNLPNTALPTSVRHGTEDVVWIDTTDGPFVLLTNRNPDYHTWRAIKILNDGLNLGYAATPLVYSGKLYVLQPALNGSNSFIRVWEAPIPTGNTVTLTAKILTGTNCNGTAQNAEEFKHFDKMWGNKGEKCYAYTEDKYYDYVNISHAGDQFDYIQVGGQVRVCHNGNHYTSNSVSSSRAQIPLSYLIDLTTGRVIEDAPENYPIVISRNGFSVHTPRKPLASYGGNFTINGKRANGKTFAYMTWGRLESPRLFHLENSGSMSDMENCKWNAQYWRRAASGEYVGLYGTKLHSGLRGSTVFGQNRIMAVCMDNTNVDFRYDPFGSYSPVMSGYGPTNDRENIDVATHRKLKQIIWVNEEGGYVGRGVCLWANRLSAESTYEGGYFGNPISITDDQYMATKKTAIDRFVNMANGPITDSTLTLMIHRVPGVPQLAYLQVIQEVANGNGQRVARYYIFNITTDRSHGAIGSITVGAQVMSGDHTHSARDIEQTSDRLWNTTALIHKLEDGGNVIALAGARVAHIGNTSTLMAVVVRDHSGNVVKTFSSTTDTLQGVTYMGTRELGFGITSISGSGEGLYLNSYGRTAADIVRNHSAGTPTKYVLALSRSDAGDNLAISQYAATVTRDKVQSLIPPARRIQGMDLTQDRVITRAMLENSDRLTNLADIDYPEQPKHHDSLGDRAVASHTHKPDAFTMAAATKLAYGSAKLAPLSGSESDAVDITVMSAHTDGVRDLIGRDKTLDKLDDSIIVIYEV